MWFLPQSFLHTPRRNLEFAGSGQQAGPGRQTVGQENHAVFAIRLKIGTLVTRIFRAPGVTSVTHCFLLLSPSSALAKCLLFSYDVFSSLLVLPQMFAHALL